VKLPPEATMRTAVKFVPNQLVTSSKSPPHTATWADDQFTLLLDFNYDLHNGSMLQSFTLLKGHWSSTIKFHVVLLEILQN
jgi:hypothetical protein